MYSIKTDLDVSGNGTINKDLLVKGNAVVKGDLKVEGTVDFAHATFTQIDVSGTANLKDITSTGTAALTTVSVSGNTTLGDASTDTLNVKATSTFDAPVTLNGNVTQTTGTAAFKATSVDSLTVAGESQLNGDLVMGTGTKATMKDLETDTLKVNGDSVIGGTLNVTGASTFGDVVINGTLSGNYTMDAGNFNSIKVAQLSDLNNVNIKGTTTITGNITASNSTMNLKHLYMRGADAIIDFDYADPSRPTDIKSSVEPYQISSNYFLSKNIKSNAAEIGVVGGTEGLHAIGRANIDYLNITGNSTIGDQTQLQVAGKSVFTGKTTVGDLEITGSVTGLSFSDLNVDSLTVSGLSQLQGGVSVGGNITGSTTSIASFSTITVRDGTGGNHGIIQFAYSDENRPTDIKSSIEPYQISSNNFLGKELKTNSAEIGVVGGTEGLHAIGKATIDYLKIAGNSTIGTASPQLEVTGKSILGDVDFTGTVTGLTVDVSGQDLTPNSVTTAAGVVGETLESKTTTKVGTNLTVGGTASVTGNASFGGDVNVTGQTVTVKDLVVTGSVTGVTAEANVDGLDIAPNSVTSTTYVKSATLEVSGASTLQDVTVKGTISGDAGAAVQVNKLNSAGTITATGNISAPSAQFTGSDVALDVTNNATIGGTLNVTGKTTVGDLTVTGTLIPGNLDLSQTDIASQSITTTGNANIGGDLVVTGTVDLSSADVSVKSLTTPGIVTSTDLVNASKLPVLNSNTITATEIDATDLTVTGQSVVKDLSASGKVTAGSVQTATITNADGITLSNNTIASGDLTVNGTLVLAGALDLSSVDIEAKSIHTTENASFDGNLSVGGTVDLTGADVTAISFTASDTVKTNTFPVLSSTTATIANATVTDLNATTSKVGTLTATGNTTLAGLTAGASVLESATVTGDATFNGNITSTNSTVAIDKNTSVTGDLAVSGTLTAGVIDLSTTDVSVKSLDSLGNAHVAGDLTVDGQFDLSATNLQAASLASTGNTTVGADLVLTTGIITGSPKISGTLNVTGATTLAGLNAGSSTLNSATVTTTLNVSGATTLADLSATSATAGTLSTTGKATLNSAEIATNAVVKGNLTIEGILLPQGGLDLTGADIEANSITLAAGASVGSTLNVTGLSTLAGVNSGNHSITGTLNVSGESKLSDVSVGNNLTVTGTTTLTDNLTVNGANTTLKKTKTDNLHVGTLTWDEAKYIAEIGGDVHISGNIDVDGLITADLDLTGRSIAPRQVTTSADVTVGTTLNVIGQSTMASAIIGDVGSVNNNLQINGNTVCTGDFTVQGKIIGTLDQSTSDVVAKSVTASTFVKAATAEITSTSSFGGKVTASAGVSVTGGTTSDTITTTGLATLDSAKVTTSLGVTGDTTVGGTLGVTGETTLAATTISSLTVSGESGFTGKATFVDLESTGSITAKDVTITGTLNTDIADLVTSSVTTSKYEVKAAASEVVGATWTPDGSSNVYNITLSEPTLDIPTFPYRQGYAGSWFIYVTQPAAGGCTINWVPPFGLIGDSKINEAANSVSICQVVYSGVGDKLDVFIAQRNL
ncbi:beta strand repeat-containing protein [Salmonella enterica]|uniref:beta strand repeat-containing protein n=1 Tax=Salmonella enterica TaxID=28901 RepID=UPI003A7FFA20